MSNFVKNWLGADNASLPVRQYNYWAMVVKIWLEEAREKEPGAFSSDQVLVYGPGPFVVRVVGQSQTHVILIPVGLMEDLYEIILNFPRKIKTCRRLPERFVRRGTICAAPFAGGWFRARIRGITYGANGVTLRVRLVDLGITFHVDESRVRMVPRSWLPVNRVPRCFAARRPSPPCDLGSMETITLLHKNQEDGSWEVEWHVDTA